ncbi:MAG: hypothetical protein AABY11_02435 [archaeon]
MSIFFGRPDLMIIFLAQVLLIILQIVLYHRLGVHSRQGRSTQGIELAMAATSTRSKKSSAKKKSSRKK